MGRFNGNKAIILATKLWLVSLVLLFLGIFLSADKPTYQLKPYKIIRIYQDGQDFLLNKPSDFFVTQNEIVISDKGENCIIITDINGHLKTKFGKPGQGPTDLNKPYRVFPIDKRIGVLDSGNYEIKIFNKKGELIEHFPAFTMAEVRGGVCFYRDGSYCWSTDGYAKDYLISYRTLDGEEKGRIGKIYGKLSYIYRFETKEIKKGNVPDSYKNRVIPMFDDDKNVFCIHRSLPIVRKYTTQGKLLWERKIEGKEIDKIKEKWIKANKKTPPNVTVSLEYWRDVQYHDKALYLLLYLPERMVIYKLFENNGHLVKLVGEEKDISMIRVLNNDLWAYSDTGQYFIIYKDALKIGR